MVLGQSLAVSGLSRGSLGAIFWQACRAEHFSMDSMVDLECQKGAIWRAKSEQKSIQNRVEISKGKKMPLGSDLGGFELTFQAVFRSNMLFFRLFLKVFVKINVFDKDQCSRAIREQKWSKNAAKMSPK